MKQRFSTRTRLVSALLTLAMVFTFLPISAFAEEELTDNYGIIPLVEYVLPDAAFRKYLKKFDTNNDDILAPAERYAVKEINVASENISNLFGIQFFPNLRKLVCYSNQLTELDVSKNTVLEYLDCSNNQLTSLDVRQNTKLDVLWCYQNQLTELDVRQNAALEYLYCQENQLTELDVSRNNKICELEANNNYLTNLNVNNTSIDIDNSGSKFFAKNNTYPITVGSDRTFDLSTLPGTFDVTKATRWNGGTVRGNTLTVKAGATKVTYLYDCGKRSSYTFTLNVTVVPEGSIAIDASNFPDEAFRTYVQTYFDTDGNGYLQNAECKAVTGMFPDKKNLTNLKGVEHFPNLKKLYCYDNQVSSLDVSKNTALEELICYNNQLSSLDVSNNTALKKLNC